MKFTDYLKERWTFYTFIFIAIFIVFAVFKFDNKISMNESNAEYLSFLIIILLVLFTIVDYSILKMRYKRILSGVSNAREYYSFYALDNMIVSEVQELISEHETYKNKIRTQSAQQLEFITRWIHDVKVPIAALQLILENNEETINSKLYPILDTEIKNIEEKTKKVFFHIKSDAFIEDYVVEEASTLEMIKNALKEYSRFFSYKKINIEFSQKYETVLTDKKWSGYIISEIISNAVKYTPVGGKITIDTIRNDKEIVISIKNTSSGIASKDINQIFNKGYTSSKDRNGLKSTGYGMYLSKKICDILGHKITVEPVCSGYVQFNLIYKKSDVIYDITKM
ncbi:sensor histidine kinase [Clostridiaceae bacterium M8S5]|nr:sensor histidine kinase [Clostridiaceae bacterium M8S5]